MLSFVLTYTHDYTDLSSFFRNRKKNPKQTTTTSASPEISREGPVSSFYKRGSVWAWDYVNMA